MRSHYRVSIQEIRQIRQEYKIDSFLNRIKSGKWSNLSKREGHFRRISNMLTVEDEIIRYGSKIVPPQSLYKCIFEIAHQTYDGMNATTKMISKDFFWPQM